MARHAWRARAQPIGRFSPSSTGTAATIPPSFLGWWLRFSPASRISSSAPVPAGCAKKAAWARISSSPDTWPGYACARSTACAIPTCARCARSGAMRSRSSACARGPTGGISKCRCALHAPDCASSSFRCVTAFGPAAPRKSRAASRDRSGRRGRSRPHSCALRARSSESRAHLNNRSSDLPDLEVRAPAPEWFRWALARSKQSRHVVVEGCPIHYLLWPAGATAEHDRGLLFVHGGGAHAHWWSFIAPYFVRDFRVAAIDLSGMGDSGRRQTYGSDIRAAEMRAVIADAPLGARPFVIGHSFGGFMTMKLASQYGDELAGAVIVDSPIRSPEEEIARPLTPPNWGNKKIYPSFEAALARFRLMPPQPCENEFIVEYIARHSLMRVEGGWTWKFDGAAIGARR